jgi:Tol biopolymer transport system component
MNYEIFTADVRDGKLTNITRVTKTIDKNECGPFWTDDENIAYQELNMDDLKKNHYYVMDSKGNTLKEITESEYWALREY